MSPREQLNLREIKVATLVWQGRTNPEIALTLGTSEQVVKNQLRSVFDKLGVWSRLGWRSISPRTAASVGLTLCQHGSTRLRRLRMRLRDSRPLECVRPGIGCGSATTAGSAGKRW